MSLGFWMYVKAASVDMAQLHLRDEQRKERSSGKRDTLRQCGEDRFADQTMADREVCFGTP